MSGGDYKICKDGSSTKSNNDEGLCDEVNDMLHDMSTNDNNVSVCSNCGKEGGDINNICNKCNQVRYCNAACKKKHRHKHKKECEEYVRLAAERAAELHDKELFKQPPPLDDCPICFVQLPIVDTGRRYQSCCGKTICSGCSYAPVYDNQGNEVDNQKCPFCRTPTPTKEEIVTRDEKRMEANDAEAIFNIGCDYRDGTCGYPQDYAKALELYHRAAELGHAGAYYSIGYAHDNGRGVEIDKKKTTYFYELAAIKGDVWARYNLGNNAWRIGNIGRALKHYMIAVEGGDSKSLDAIKQLYSKGYATKEDYTKALQSYQEYLGEIKSAQRDKAAAAREDHRYY